MKILSVFNRCVLLLLSVIIFACHGSKQAFSLLEKGKYDKAYQQLNRSFAKDSLHPATHYVYSLLFADTAFQYYHVDSAYSHILQAIAAYDTADARSRKKLAKSLDLDSARLQSQRLITDSLAFEEASALHSVAAYQRFMVEHTAAAPQYEEAMRLRNQLAYQQARQTDTYQAYKAFMDTYPEAEQFGMAKERYNTLVFREKTKGGNLDSYITFLKAFPQSPYRPQAEEQILKISTADNRLESYASFARQYPKSQHSRLAVNILYHLYKSARPAGNFLKAFPGLPFADSLGRVAAAEHRLLIPVLENGRYGFMNSRGKMAIPAQYPFIQSRYLCQGVTGDFIHTANSRDRQFQHSLLTKDGKTIITVSHPGMPNVSPGPFTSRNITDIGMGLWLIQQQAGKYVLRHKSGHLIMPEAYETIDTAVFMPSPAAHRQQTPFQFIKFSAEGRWGLMTFAGKTLLKARYDDIEEYDAFVVVEKEGRLAITNRKALLQQANNVPLALDFAYEDVSLVDSHYLVAYTGDYETVFDENLQTEVPAGKYNILRHISQTRQWLLKKETSRQFIRNDSLISTRLPTYYLYDSRNHVLPQEYSKAFYTEKWLALQQKKGFEFFDFAGNTPRTLYDSVKILSDHLVLLFQKDSVTAHFSNQQQLKLPRYAQGRELQFRLVKSAAEQHTARQQEYLMVIKEDKKQMINQQGKSLFASSMNEITAYPGHLFVIEKSGRKGLVDSTGQNLIPIQYQSIGNYQQGMLAVFENQKFGFYHHDTRTLVKPEYEAIVQWYGQPPAPEDSLAQALFIARKKGKYGLITPQNRAVTPFAFDQVQFWNDTAALVRTGENWQLYWLTAPADTAEEQRILYKDIRDFEELMTGDEERLLKIYQENGYGVLSNRRGELLPASYDEILLLGDAAEHVFFTEKYVPEADLYIVVYVDASGTMLKRQALTAEQYDRLYCDEAYL